MRLALFDLDNTLIAGDCELLWSKFLLSKGYVDVAFAHKMEQYHSGYARGEFDINEYLKLILQPLSQYSPDEWMPLRSQFLNEVIRPIVFRQARDLISWYKRNGYTPLVVTASCDFLAVETSNLILRISEVISTETEVIDGAYSGNCIGIPNFGEGKVLRLNEWLDYYGLDQEILSDSFFYSDSINDLPLLEYVGNPVAVNPDPMLSATAELRGWPCLEWRNSDRESGLQ